jgi:hypothetical protein
MENSYKNPFSGTNAVTLDDNAILKYWCSPFAYRLFSEVKERDIFEDTNNIIFMGGRSTGKTMFLRFWSFPVQIQIAENNKRISGRKIIDYFSEKGGIGFYIRIDGLILRSFNGSGNSIEKWSSLFSHYFEIYTARLYIEAIKVINDNGEFDNQEVKLDLIPKIGKLLGTDEFKTIDDILNYLDQLKREVDAYRGNMPFYNNSFSPKKGFASGSLIFGIPEIIRNTITPFKGKISFILLIDEYENYLEHQQRILNTFLRFTKTEVRIRIGMRLEGFRTTSMITEDDFIKEGREYQKVVFEEVLIKSEGYKDFLKEVCKKRLENVEYFAMKGMTDIEKFLGESENLEDEAIEIVKTDRDKIFEHYKKILNNIEVNQLRCDSNPLLELLNILWLSRGKSANDIKRAMDNYLEGNDHDEITQKYRRDYIDKYKLSLAFILNSIYKRRKRYYSFNTFSFLSSGIVGNFIELCRRAFQYAEFEDSDMLLYEGRIEKEQQNKAAWDVAESELRQLPRIEECGTKIYSFIMNLGNIFREFHKDEGIKYPETNQFSTDVNSIKEKAYLDSFKAAIKWSAIQGKSKIQQNAPGKELANIYTINRILCPAFEISYRTRGGYSVPLSAENITQLMNEQIENVKVYIPNKAKQKNLDQFDLGFENE